MELKNVLGVGVLVAGLAASVTMAQNRLDIGTPGRAAVQDATASGVPNPVLPSAIRVEFAESQTLKLDRVSGGAYVSAVLLYNPHCTTETVELTPQLLDRNDEPFDVLLEIEKPGGGSPSRATIMPRSYERVRFKIKPTTAKDAGGVRDAIWAVLLSSPINSGSWGDHLPARGVLVLTRHTAASTINGCTTSDNGPNSRQSLILQPQLPSAVDTGVLLASLILALAVTLIAAATIFFTRDQFLRARLGEMTFDFRNSWGTNVAIGAGILTALISSGMQDRFSSNSAMWLVLAGLLGSLVPAGAALYGLIRPPVKLPSDGPQLQGYVNVYLLSSAVILWGAFGQLLLLGMILREMDLAGVMAQEPTLALIVMTKILILCLIVYAIITALATVRQSSDSASREAPTTAKTPRPAAPMI